MKVNHKTNLNKLKNKIYPYCSEYKRTLFLCLFVFVVGLGFGIYTAIKFSGSIKLSNMFDENLIDFLKGKRGVMGLFFPYFFSFLFCSLPTILIKNKFWLNLYVNLIILIKSYLIGFDITIFVLVYNLAGIFNLILIILPYWLLPFFVFIIICAISLKISSQTLSCKHKNICVNNKQNSNWFWILILFGAVLILILCALLPFVRYTIIIN